MIKGYMEVSKTNVCQCPFKKIIEFELERMYCMHFVALVSNLLWCQCEPPSYGRTFRWMTFYLEFILYSAFQKHNPARRKCKSWCISVKGWHHVSLCVVWDSRPLGPRGGRRCFLKPRSPHPLRWPPPPERSSPASPGFGPSSSDCPCPYTRRDERYNPQERLYILFDAPVAPSVRQHRRRIRELSIVPSLACSGRFLTSRSPRVLSEMIGQQKKKKKGVRPPVIPRTRTTNGLEKRSESSSTE